MAIFLGYVFLTVVMTWPLVTKMSTHLAGDNVDVWLNQWATWWTGKAITDGLDLYQTEYLLHPRGASLAFFSFSHANTAVSLLLTPLIGRFASYNIPVFLAYALSGFSMYLFAEHLTGSRTGAFVAGIVFAFNSNHMSESSHLHLVSTQWIPLCMLALSRMLRDTGTGAVRQTWSAALWFLVTALSGWHLMTMLAALMALYLLWQAIFERDECSPRALARLVMLAIIVGITVIPFMLPILREHLTADTSYVAVDVRRGQGYDLVERPAIRFDEPMKLKANMNIVVHPIVATERTFAWVCDNYLVTETGASECLHKMPKRIFEL